MLEEDPFTEHEETGRAHDSRRYRRHAEAERHSPPLRPARRRDRRDHGRLSSRRPFFHSHPPREYRVHHGRRHGRAYPQARRRPGHRRARRHEPRERRGQCLPGARPPPGDQRPVSHGPLAHPPPPARGPGGPVPPHHQVEPYPHRSGHGGHTAARPGSHRRGPAGPRVPLSAERCRPLGGPVGCPLPGRAVQPGHPPARRR